MTESDPGVPILEHPPQVSEDRRRPPTRSTTGGRVVVVLAALAIATGLVILIGGPVRSALQERDGNQKAQKVATDLTCFRFQSLGARVAAAEVRPEEIRTRASDVAVGARQARHDVAVAAHHLADELTDGQVRVGDAAWVALAEACQRS
jgi:hypothetical protein